MAAADADGYTKVKWNGWGAKNRKMEVDAEDPSLVRHTSGKIIRGILPFINTELGDPSQAMSKLDNTPSITIEEAIQKLQAPIVNPPFLAQMKEDLKEDQVKSDGESRVTHIFGKNYRDLWRMRRGMINRAPDVVLLPESHDDVVKIVNAAQKHNVVLIPFGGGTNVTGCVEPNPFETRRMIASVDIRRMSKMISIDKQSRTAVFQVGVMGPDLDEQLGRHGFMFGHDPDSYIYSCLGGWIGARSSGAYSNKYGDIEDMVLAVKLVTPGRGVIETPVAPRQCGMDLKHIIIGSEGAIGIVTEATIKIEPLPAVRRYEGWLFPSFEAGFAAFYKLTNAGISPCCLRLYDDDETRMSFALKTDTPFVQTVLSKGIKQFLSTVKGFDMNKVCLCIIGFEGTQTVVDFQRAQTKGIFCRHNAFNVGTGAGDNWQEKKYDLPYFRDFALSHKLWADVFETTTVYSEALSLWKGVKDAVRQVWKAEGKKGWIGCHTAHQYKTGCCLYFTFAGQQFDDNDMATLFAIKRAATEVMIKCKGNLTHHHGIGYEHVPWMPRYYQQGALDWMLRMKADLDPQDICNPGKLLPPARKKGESDAALEERRAKVMMFDKMGLPSAKL